MDNFKRKGALCLALSALVLGSMGNVDTVVAAGVSTVKEATQVEAPAVVHGQGFFFGRADVDAAFAARAVVRRNLDAEAIAFQAFSLCRQRGESRWSLLAFLFVDEDGADSCMGADQ